MSIIEKMLPVMKAFADLGDMVGDQFVTVASGGEPPTRGATELINLKLVPELEKFIRNLSDDLSPESLAELEEDFTDIMDALAD